MSFPPTLAEDGKSETDDPFFERRGIDDRAAFFFGGISSEVETTVQVNSETGFGSALLLERIFELPRDRNYPRFQGYYRFSRRHRIDFRYLRVSSSGTNTLVDEDISVGPFTFEVGGEIGARPETRFGAVEYRYAFVNNGRAEAGLAVGLGVVDIDLEIFGEVSVSPFLVRSVSETVNETIPLPVAGSTRTSPSPRVCSFRSRGSFSLRTTTNTPETSATSGPPCAGTR